MHPARLRLAHWPRSTGHGSIVAFSIQSVRLLPPYIIHLNVIADRLPSVRTVLIKTNASHPYSHCHYTASVQTLRPSKPSKLSIIMQSHSSPPWGFTGSILTPQHPPSIFISHMSPHNIFSFLSLPKHTVRTVRESSSLNVRMNPLVHLL